MFGQGILKSLTAATLMMLTVGAASAAPVNCSTLSPDVSNNVTLNIGCMALISPDNDSNAAVNGMFSIFGWDQIGKVDPLPGINGALTLAGDMQGGSWSIDSSVFAAWQDVMLVFKGGDKALPDAVIAYLISGSATTGANGIYATPFFDLDKDGNYKPKNISHVSLYVANKVVLPPVPLPAAGFLLLGALGGLAAMRRRRKA